MRTTSWILIAALLGAAVPVSAADPAPGTVQVTVTAAGAPACRVAIALVDLASGASYEKTTSEDGSATLDVPPGSYTLSVQDPRGRVLLQAPTTVAVRKGRTVPVAVALAGVSTPRLQNAAVSLEDAVAHHSVTCFVAGRASAVDAELAPGYTARVLYRTARAADAALTPVEAEVVPGTAYVQAELPAFTLEDMAVEYQIEVTGPAGTTRTAPARARVVATPADCRGCDELVAAPAGQALLSPVILAAAAGSGIPGALLGVLGVVGAGTTAAVVVDQGNASPSR